MPASKAEQVLDALKALLERGPGTVVERNSVLPEKVPVGGLIIVRDGDPGEPEQALGGFGNAYYRHAVEIEVYIEVGDTAARDAAFDTPHTLQPLQSRQRARPNRRPGAGPGPRPSGAAPGRDHRRRRHCCAG
jgi:hypothetical protein